MESLKHLNTLHAWKTVEYFLPFKNISKYPPVSQSKRILQLSVQPLSEHKVESCRVFYLAAGASLWGKKAAGKNTVARLLKQGQRQLLREWSEETCSSRPQVNRFSLNSHSKFPPFHTELPCDQLVKVFNIRRTFTLMDSSSSNHQLKVL